MTPMCGWDLWQILVTSLELLIFALFMMPDPRTVPGGQAARFVFGVFVGDMSVRIAALLPVALLLVWALPLSADLSTHGLDARARAWSACQGRKAPRSPRAQVPKKWQPPPWLAIRPFQVTRDWAV